ncbi:hypothetical protein AB205_0024760 [Aquarana catesbeiana]|uniref:RING-type E3 ubiquitin transferase n=1 Tax=Aquarana catesbeiana TaxID=8400 RepID=A0A2G9SLT0_AQUCT|nr:hypothetical protein AB205_0024760 [Aquarana catesbeiana]
MNEPRIPGSLALGWLGLLLALAPGGSLAKETAFVEVVLFESSPNGDYKTHTTELQGRFSRAGATISAEGEIVQLNQGLEDPLKRPVVYMKGMDAIKLMNIVNKQKGARARIQHRPPRLCIMLC